MDNGRGRGRGVTVSDSIYSLSPPGVRSNIMRGLGRGSINSQGDNISYSSSSTTGTDESSSSSSEHHFKGKTSLTRNAQGPSSKPTVQPNNQNQYSRPQYQTICSSPPSIQQLQGLSHDAQKHANTENTSKHQSTEKLSDVQHSSKLLKEHETSKQKLPTQNDTGRGGRNITVDEPAVPNQKARHQHQYPMNQWISSSQSSQELDVDVTKESTRHQHFTQSSFYNTQVFENMNETGSQGKESQSDSSLGTWSGREPTVQPDIPQQHLRHQKEPYLGSNAEAFGSRKRTGVQCKKDQSDSCIGNWSGRESTAQPELPQQHSRHQDKTHFHGLCKGSQRDSGVGTWSGREPTVHPVIPTHQSRHRHEHFNSQTFGNRNERSVQQSKESQRGNTWTWSPPLEARGQPNIYNQWQRHQNQAQVMKQWQGSSDNAQGQRFVAEKIDTQDIKKSQGEGAFGTWSDTEKQNSCCQPPIIDKWQDCTAQTQVTGNLVKETPVQSCTNDIFTSSTNHSKDNLKESFNGNSGKTFASNSDYICDDLGGGFDDWTVDDVVPPHHSRQQSKHPANQVSSTSASGLSTNMFRHQNQHTEAEHSQKDTAKDSLPSNFQHRGKHHENPQNIKIFSRNSPHRDPVNRGFNVSAKNDNVFRDSTGQIWVAPSSEQKQWRHPSVQGNWRNQQYQGSRNWEVKGNWRGQQNPGNWKNQQDNWRTPNRDMGEWKGPYNQRPVNRNYHQDQRSSSEGSGNWRGQGQQVTNYRRSQNTPTKVTTENELTMEEKKNEFEWQRFKVVRKVKKVLSSVTMDEVKSKAKEISDIMDSEVERLAPFPADWPKERHVALEQILEKAIQDEEFCLIAGHLMKYIYELIPERFMEILIEVLVKKEPEYVKVSTATNSSKIRASYCFYLSSLLSASVGDEKFKVVVEGTIIRVIQRWLYFDIKAEHSEMDEFLSVLGICLTTLVKSLLPYLECDQQRKIFNLIKDKTLANGSRKMKLSSLSLLLQWSSDWKEDLFYTSYLEDPDTSEQFIKVKKEPKSSANGSDTNKDSGSDVVKGSGQDTEKMDNSVKTNEWEIVERDNSGKPGGQEIGESNNSGKTGGWEIGESDNSKKTSGLEIGESENSVKTSGWEVEESNNSGKTDGWEFGESDNSKKTSGWEIGESENSVKTSGWEVEESDNNVKTSGWEVEESDNSVKTSGWEVEEMDNSVKTSGWEVEESDNSVKTSGWEVEERDNSEKTSGWEVEESNNSEKTSGWEIGESENSVKTSGWEVEESDNSVKTSGQNIGKHEYNGLTGGEDVGKIDKSGEISRQDTDTTVARLPVPFIKLEGSGDDADLEKCSTEKVPDRVGFQGCGCEVRFREFSRRKDSTESSCSASTGSVCSSHSTACEYHSKTPESLPELLHKRKKEKWRPFCNDSQQSLSFTTDSEEGLTWTAAK